MMSFTADGTILAGIFEGLSVSRDRAAGGPSSGAGSRSRYVIDLAVDKVDPTKGVLVISNSASQDDAGHRRSSRSSGRRATTARRGRRPACDLPPSFLGLTVDTAPSDPQPRLRERPPGPARLPGRAPALRRSRRHLAAAPHPRQRRQAPAVHRRDRSEQPRHLYVRLDGEPQRSAHRLQGRRQTWTSVFETRPPGDMLGFALSPDGSHGGRGRRPRTASGPRPRARWRSPRSSTMSVVPDLGRGRALRLRGRVRRRVHRRASPTIRARPSHPSCTSGGLCGPLACGRRAPSRSTASRSGRTTAPASAPSPAISRTAARAAAARAARRAAASAASGAGGRAAGAPTRRAGAGAASMMARRGVARPRCARGAAPAPPVSMHAPRLSTADLNLLVASTRSSPRATSRAPPSASGSRSRR